MKLKKPNFCLNLPALFRARRLRLEIFAVLFCVLCALNSFVQAQSGRVKPNETPTPTPRPRIVYAPTEKISTNATVNPSPTPTPKIDDDGGDINIQSTLVPI